MGKKNELQDATKFLDNLAEFVAEPDDLPKEELKGELEQYGYNTENLVANVKSLVSHKLEEHRLSWRKEAQGKNKYFGSNLSSDVLEWVDLSFVDIKEEIRSILSSFGGNFALEYRNYEKLEKEDLIQVLSDLKELASVAEESKKE